MAIRTPEKIRKEIKTDKGLHGTDFIYIVLTFAVSGLFIKPFIYEPISWIFVLYTTGVSIYLMLPNREVVHTKNFEFIWNLLTKDSHIYHAQEQYYSEGEGLDEV